MQKKKLIIMLVLLLTVFNVGTSFAYWATQINGNNANANAELSVGQWIVVPPGSTVVTEEVLIQLLSGELPLDGDYVLTGDVDLSDYEDNAFEPIVDFTGTFNGNGFTIGGFEIINTSTDSNEEVGMFLNVGSDAEISDITVSDVTIVQNDGSTGNNTSETTYVGVLVGNNQGTISNIEVTGSTVEAGNTVNGVLGTGSMTLYAGGLVGRNNGTIINSYARVNVTLNSSVSASWFGSGTANIYVGGLVGYNAGTISQSYSTGNVTSNVDTSTSGWGASLSINTFTGGLVGLNVSGGYVHHVFATGNINVNVDTSSGSRYIGRVVGRNQGTTASLYRLNTSTITCNQSYTNYTTNTTSATMANLQSQTYLTNNLGFDFVEVWQTVPSNYPIIKQN